MKNNATYSNDYHLYLAAGQAMLLFSLILNSCSIFPSSGFVASTAVRESTSTPGINIEQTENSLTQTIQANESGVIETWQPMGSGTPENICVARAEAGKPFDITIPDGTELLPGQSFNKTWRLVNSGTCAWDAGYSLMWFSGTFMSSQEKVPFVQEVKPGESVDVNVLMTAPVEPGEFQSNWKLSNEESELFGIGPNGDSPFWVRVKVLPEVLPTPGVTVTPTALPMVFSSGGSMMVLDDGFDLDNGLQNPVTGIDVYLRQLETGELVLIPVNGAGFALAESEPSLFYCQNVIMSNHSVLLSAIPVDQKLCYLTDLGLPGMLNILQVQIQEKFIEIDYTTWVIP